MRNGTSNRRQRSRNNNGRRNNQQRTHVYDSNGPDVRIRGTAHQVAEKYLTLAKDASSAGDIIVAENYYQHAEHYIRLINEQNGVFQSENDHRQKDVEGANSHGNVRSHDDGSDDLGLPESIVEKKRIPEKKESEMAD